MPDTTDTIQNSCTPWCERQTQPGHASDPACWSSIDHCIPLTLEEGFPVHALPGKEMLFDPPRIGLNAYRRERGCIEVIHMHLYRPSNNSHVDLDDAFNLTLTEARNLIKHLNEVITEIEQGQIAGAPW